MRTALVTGATRGVGKGVAVSLAAAGFKVFATGRTIGEASLPATVTRIPCDHTKTEQNDELFRRIAENAGTLDVLVNSAWGGYERMVENGAFTWGAPFWQQPLHRWAGMIDGGVRAAFVASALAARVMVAQRRGVIVNISFWPAQKYIGSVISRVAKAAPGKLTADTAHELKPHGVVVLSLYPGLVRTESVMAAAEGGWLDISNSESPEFIGRVVAALADDPTLADRSGGVEVAAAAALRLGVVDVDGRQPRPLTLDMV